MKMLGPPSRPRLKAKAAESRNLIPLAVQLCIENFQFLGPQAAYLQGACQELHRFYKTMDLEPRIMSKSGLDIIRQSAIRFLSYWKHYGGHLVFKHHCLFHIVELAGKAGNPKCYWTYADENENRWMGRVAKSLHGGRTFYTSFLQKMLLEV